MADTGDMPTMPKVTNRVAVALGVAMQLLLDRTVKDGKYTVEETIKLANLVQDGLTTLLSGEKVYLGDMEPNCPVCGVDLDHPVASYIQWGLDETVKDAQKLEAERAALPTPNAPTSQEVM